MRCRGRCLSKRRRCKTRHRLLHSDERMGNGSRVGINGRLSTTTLSAVSASPSIVEDRTDRAGNSTVPMCWLSPRGFKAHTRYRKEVGSETGKHTSRPLFLINGPLKVGPLLLKKLHVLSALEIQKYRAKIMKSTTALTKQVSTRTDRKPSASSNKTTAQTLAGRAVSYGRLISDASLRTPHTGRGIRRAFG